MGGIRGRRRQPGRYAAVCTRHRQSTTNHKPRPTRMPLITHTRRAPFTAGRGNQRNAPRHPNVGGPDAGRSPGAGRAGQRARDRGLRRTLKMLRSRHRSSVHPPARMLGRRRRPGQRRLALCPREPAPHGSATPHSPELGPAPRRRTTCMCEEPHYTNGCICFTKTTQARCSLARVRCAEFQC